MEKQMEDKLKKDEEQDILLVQEVLGKEKNMIKVASILSQKLQQKYGSEFGGIVRLEFDVPSAMFTLTCGRDYVFEIEENDIEDVPIRIKMFREQAVEDKNKPKPSIFHKEDQNKQKLKTESGDEISVSVKKTADAEEELDEEYEEEEVPKKKK